MPTGRKLKIAVCDDAYSDRTQITQMTKHILQDADILFALTVYESSTALLNAIQGGAQFQILLLDVMMNEMDGMELAAELRKQNRDTAIIFISSNLEMAMRGYEVSAARYLAKPLGREKLKEALLYCHKHIQGKKEILLPTAQGQHRISLADIQYVEAFDRGTRFVLAERTVESRLKFSEAEKLLPSFAFLRCHRAYLVSLSCIVSIRRYEFTLKNGQTVPIGKGRYGEVHRRFVDYLSD